MKNIRIFAGTLACMLALSSSGALAQEIEVAPQEVAAMSMPQSRMISGTFNDYFPDAELAKTVAKALQKAPTDIVTLWELQEVRVLLFGTYEYDSVKFLGSSIDFKNIGYLMNLEKISFIERGRGDKYGNIDLKFYDDVLNCKKFTTIRSEDVPIVIPDILASSTLDTIELMQEAFSPKRNMPILSKAILEKFNNGLLQISYGRAGCREDVYTYEKGSDFDIRHLIAPTFLQTMPKLAKSMTCYIDKTMYDWSKSPDLEWNATSSETFDQFLDRISQQVLEMSKTNEGLYVSIRFDSGDFGGANIKLPIVVVKGSIQKDINVTGTTFTGTPVQIIGQIKGKFDNGSNFPDRATIDAQELQIIIDGQTFDSSAIFNMQVSVVDDQITNGLIVGQANNQFFSIIFN